MPSSELDCVLYTFPLSKAFRMEDEVDSTEVLKSVGIDKEGGLVFALDTLQVTNGVLQIKNSCSGLSDYKNTLEHHRSQSPGNKLVEMIWIWTINQDRHNKFWIKVHKAGDVPRMQVGPSQMESWKLKLQEDKSSWAKIDVNSNDMLTKFVTIKGEDVFAKKPYKEIKVKPD